MGRSRRGSSRTSTLFEVRCDPFLVGLGWSSFCSLLPLHYTQADPLRIPPSRRAPSLCILLCLLLRLHFKLTFGSPPSPPPLPSRRCRRYRRGADGGPRPEQARHGRGGLRAVGRRPARRRCHAQRPRHHFRAVRAPADAPSGRQELFKRNPVWQRRGCAAAAGPTGGGLPDHCGADAGRPRSPGAVAPLPGRAAEGGAHPCRDAPGLSRGIRLRDRPSCGPWRQGRPASRWLLQGRLSRGNQRFRAGARSDDPGGDRVLGRVPRRGSVLPDRARVDRG